MRRASTGRPTSRLGSERITDASVLDLRALNSRIIVDCPATSRVDLLTRGLQVVVRDARLRRKEDSAARALLALKRIDSSRHSGVIALFQEHFVRTEAVPPGIARALPQTFARRQRSDDGDFADAQAPEVQALRNDVEQFVRACEEVVNRG